MTTTAWTESAPLDSNAISGGAGEIRALKIAIQERFGLEHSMVAAGTDVNDGRHLLANDIFANRPAPDVAGRAFISTDTKMLSVTTGAAEWFDLPFPPGTVMTFNQATAPLGWTIATGLDGLTLIMTSTAGGVTGGSWTISGIAIGSEASHVHNVAGNTGVPAPNATYLADGGGGPYGGINHLHAVNITSGAGTSHTHTLVPDGSWRPAFQYVIPATKN